MIRTGRFVPSRRDLLGVAVAAPAAALPLPPMGAESARWRAAIENWRRAEAGLEPIARRFNAAEARWFASKDEAAASELERATYDHNCHLDRCDDARSVLLRTRAPDLAAVIWKLGVVRDRLGRDMPDELTFLLPDLRALDNAPHGDAS
jgi:hypothetical protein